MFRFLAVLLVTAFVTTSLAQPQVSSSPTAAAPVLWSAAPVVVHVNGGTLSLADNYYNPTTRRLLVAGTDYTQSWVVSVDFRAANYTATSIPPAITNGDVIAVGISKDGQYVYGWMDSPTSNPNFVGEGFFAPVGNPGNRTLVGFLSSGVNESMVRDMSANGVVVGDGAGGLQGFLWTSGTGIVPVPNPGTGGSSARAISANAVIGYGMFSVAGPGTEQAGAWVWGNPYPLPCTALSISGGCSPNGLIAAGVDSFNACAWIHGAQFPINEVGTTPLNGEGRDAVDSGFCVGIGSFGGNPYGFIWHPNWQTAMTIRAYVLSRTGVDIGFDVTEANGISQWGKFLFISGADANGGVAIQVLARP